MNEQWQQQPQQQTVVQRFQSIDRQDFGREIDRLWSAATRLKSAVAEEVQGGNIPVMTGLAITSCVAATALGYESFHGEGQDILTALDVRLRPQGQGQGQQQGQRDREFSYQNS